MRNGTADAFHHSLSISRIPPREAARALHNIEYSLLGAGRRVKLAYQEYHPRCLARLGLVALLSSSVLVSLR
jgi:hypothetical protein